MEILRIENLSKRFKNVEALTNINLTISKNEIVSIIGPSGSGKSTLLRLISNLEKSNQGSIKIDNQYLLENGKYQHNPKNILSNLGMIFQDYSLFDNLNVKENIELAPILVHKKSKEEVSKDTINLLKQVGLLDKMNSYPSELSGGQKQRIAIARSLAMKPKILLIDEPTSALDVEAIDSLVNIINDLKQQNITILIVTHDIEFAKRVSTRLIFMEKSQIQFDTNVHSLNQITNERFLKFVNKK